MIILTTNKQFNIKLNVEISLLDIHVNKWAKANLDILFFELGLYPHQSDVK